MKISLLAAASIAILASSASFAAQGQAFMAPQKAASVLADGVPWAAATPDGKTLKFTLKKDGTGSIRGPMPFTLSISWTVMGDQMCITGKMGTKCLRFQAIPGGLQGWDGDKKDLTFSR